MVLGQPEERYKQLVLAGGARVGTQDPLYLSMTQGDMRRLEPGLESRAEE